MVCCCRSPHLKPRHIQRRTGPAAASPEQDKLRSAAPGGQPQPEIQKVFPDFSFLTWKPRQAGEGEGGGAGMERPRWVLGLQAELQLHCGTDGPAAQRGYPGPGMQVGAHGGAAEP